VARFRTGLEQDEPAAMTSDTARFSALEAFLADCRRRVEFRLGRLLGQPQQCTALQKAMAWASLGGGKRVRPVLVYAAARAAGSDLARADRPACAVELIHCYSLVHDDLPAMDDDDLRRGKPTVHKAFNEATAILVGDALQALAFQVLAETELDGVTPAHCLQMIRTLAAAAGCQGMVAGQALDFEAVGNRLDLTQLKTMHGLKTGALISASLELGALCSASLTESKLADLRRFGEHIGLAFQVRDDILDVCGDTATLGKRQGADQALDKPTYTSLLGLEAARAEALQLAQQAVDDLAAFDSEADLLRQLARYIVERVH
jgi:geranylgeranyl pyrophosphate synthase